jgi:short-subunit dehydrogenase
MANDAPLDAPAHGAPAPVALVTGASSGIGWATALLLARRGFRVAVTARREARLEALAAEGRSFNADVCVLPGDLGDLDFAASLPERVVEEGGRLDVVVNNAAMPMHKQIFKTTLTDVRRTVDVNFSAAAVITLAAIPVFLRRGSGTVVNVSSIAARVVPSHEAVYAASKAAMNAFTEGLWNDLHGTDIHVGLVHPGPIDTEIWSKLDEPGHYAGPLHSADAVAEGVLEVIERRRREVTIPRRDPGLVTAKLLRGLWPALLRRGVRARDPVTPEMIEAARTRARRDAPSDD